MILMIDNYDSFTFNLVQYIGELEKDVRVFRNNCITLDEIRVLNPSHIFISPGPATPDDAGICLSLIRNLSSSFPIFGVCLGHQAIGQAFGGKVIRAPVPMHGKISSVSHDNNGVFRDIPSPFSVVRYHSLIVEKKSLPDDLLITASTIDGLIMGLRHKSLRVEGVQFHPESILTEHGKKMIRNFLCL